jgi:hypothetical protein
VAPRKIVPAASLSIAEGNPSITENRGAVSFRDKDGLIRPVAPFFEIWAQTDQSEGWVPLTTHLLAENSLSPGVVQWSVHITNIKVYRRTADVNDQIHATLAPFSDHIRHDLAGISENFLPNESILLGSLQYVRPDDKHPELRIRFTPAHGKVYGTWTGQRDDNIVKAVYDPKKSSWKGNREPDGQGNTFEDRKQTNPNEIFAGYGDNGFQVSYGYVDDECDGIIEASITVGGQKLSSFARVAAGPPAFAPDGTRFVPSQMSLSRPCSDQMPQHPPKKSRTCAKSSAVLETVRLMNTGQMNKPGTTRGVGIARMDILDYSRASEPVFDPMVADSLAIRARHERVLLGLEGGSLVWFSRIFAGIRQGRRFDGRMPPPDARPDAQRRRTAPCPHSPPSEQDQGRRQLHRPEQCKASGSARPKTIQNPPRKCSRATGIPRRVESSQHRNRLGYFERLSGLEMDFRNVWRRLFVGVVHHESANPVVDVENEALRPLKGMLLVKAAGYEVRAPVTGPNDQGQVGPLANGFGETRMALEWSNALALVLRHDAGREVPCVFTPLKGGAEVRWNLRVRPFFETNSPAIAREIAEPGTLTQSLCAPWQNDYRECACFYWAANRPDYVNVESRPDGSSAGNNWLQKNRTPQTAKVYINDDWLDDRLYSHTDLVRYWEKLLRFVIGNEDEPPVA